MEAKIEETIKRVEKIFRHTRIVQDNCYFLGIKLIKLGFIDLGVKLISNGQIHDNSKFKGIEFDHLFEGDSILHIAVHHHASTNPHHPEYFNTIHDVPEVFICEMICDWSARSSEFGTDVRQWIADRATKKYNFKMEDEIGKKIIYYLDLLLEKPFS